MKILKNLFSRKTPLQKFAEEHRKMTRFVQNFDINGRPTNFPTDPQYFHRFDRHKNHANIEGRQTFYLEVPSSETILSLLESGEKSISLTFGHSKVHSKDHYNKKIGREVCESRAEKVEFDMVFSNYTVRSSDKIEVSLFANIPDSEDIITLDLELKVGRSVPWLINGDIF